MSALALENHAKQLLEFIASDLLTQQSDVDRARKSKGLVARAEGAEDSAAEKHAVLRIQDGFNLNQVIAEFRALRASIVHLWTASKDGVLHPPDLDDLTRFHESIDQLLAESVARYSQKIDEGKNLFLAVIGHDLLNPVAAASAGAEFLLKEGGLSARQTHIVLQISSSMFRARALIADLADLTRLQFGLDLPLARTNADAAVVGRQIVDEIRAIFPTRAIDLKVEGDTQGRWDSKRLGQVLSNLVANAMAHGDPDSTVTVEIKGDEAGVRLSVHNTGDPIPEELQSSIFRALKRSAPDSPHHLGLGLYVAQKLVAAHGGQLELVSSTEAGTTFSARLPRS